MAKPTEIGTYLIRFEGYALAPKAPPHRLYGLIGIGRITLYSDLTLAGEQRSTLMPLGDAPGDGLPPPIWRSVGRTTRRAVGAADPPALQHVRFKLTGEYKFDGGNIGTCVIWFQPEKNGKFGPAELEGEFAIAYQGPAIAPTTLWIISSKSTPLVGPEKGQDVYEMVRGEAVLLQ